MTARLVPLATLVVVVDHRSTNSVFDPVAAPSTYAETVARLGTAIRIGILEAGTRLPPERELAQQLGISRSTLRQGLAALTETGHLVAVRGRTGGTFVAADPPLASAEPYPLERCRALLDWRMALELGTVQLTAERGANGARALLSEAADTFGEHADVGDWAAFRRADAIFHLRLAEASSSDRLVVEMTRLQGELSDLFERLEPPVSSLAASDAEHRRVVEALLGGDAGGARDAMREHLTATERVLGDLGLS